MWVLLFHAGLTSFTSYRFSIYIIYPQISEEYKESLFIQLYNSTESPPGAEEDEGFLTSMSVKLLSAGGDVNIGVVYKLRIKNNLGKIIRRRGQPTKLLNTKPLKTKGRKDILL